MIKLFDEDSYIREFSATVKSCIPKNDGYAVLLSQTAFFPTAGGQECDGGRLDNQNVEAVFIEDDEIFHIVKSPIEVGKTVSGEIDFRERFRKMQHHSAEHIVSGIAFSRFGLNNVGFHLAGGGVTIDYDGELSENELLGLEFSANQAVWKNAEIKAFYPSEEELSKIKYRSKTDILGRVRIVEIDGIDICACCAPHVKRTGEIGVIKFTEAVRHRGGMRIKMICAGDALSDYTEKQKNAREISNMLSAPQNEISDAVLRLKTELETVKTERNGIVKKLAEKQAEDIPEIDGNFYLFTELSEKNALRMIANKGKMRVGGIFALFSGSDEMGYRYIVTAKSGVSAFLKAFNTELSAKGGGSDEMAEGQVFAARDKIEKTLENLF
ncbi:MAG: alanyl-tRNA editing protein [Clostridia bacterium]|nr:alanyl-tRNA editing protein [Clostridia bacterium]